MKKQSVLSNVDIDITAKKIDNNFNCPKRSGKIDIHGTKLKFPTIGIYELNIDGGIEINKTKIQIEIDI